jgi:hypothetical protein
MPIWHRKIDVRPSVHYYAETSDIPGTAERAVKIIEESGWLADTPYPDTLRDHLNRLKQARTVSQYTDAFEWIYDVADIDRVWIETS